MSFLYVLFLKNSLEINKSNYGMMFVMSKQVRLPKISLILQKMKISSKSDIRPFCTEAFNYFCTVLYTLHAGTCSAVREYLGLQEICLTPLACYRLYMYVVN